ncbi:hypothetical protein RB201_00060 [Streptomyces sp. S1A(2023)]
MAPSGARVFTTTRHRAARRSSPPPRRPPTAPLPHHDTVLDERAHLFVNSHTDMLNLVEDLVEPSGAPAVTGSGAPHLNAAWSRADVISTRAGRRTGGRRRTTLAPPMNE